MENARSITLASDGIFVSVQGEGKLCGVPSLFIRTAGCNLQCRWDDGHGSVSECDTAYAAYRITGSHKKSIDEILETISSFPHIRHAVITGGEPLLQSEQVSLLCEYLKKNGIHITIETNGTVYYEKIASLADLFSISPKLASSAPDGYPPEKRICTAVISRYIEAARRRGADVQIKFVVGRAEDIAEAESVVSNLCGLTATDILLMPAGSDTAALDRTAAILAEEAVKKGWRYCDRLHIRLFGNIPGK